jgi:hypothetical protein
MWMTAAIIDQGLSGSSSPATRQTLQLVLREKVVHEFVL